MANRHLGRACDHPELRTKPESGLAGGMRRHRTHEIQQLQEPRVHIPSRRGMRVGSGAGSGHAAEDLGFRQLKSCA